MKKLNDFMGKALNQKESTEVKGGKAYVPSDSGSVGYINWDDVIIRSNNFNSTPYESIKSGFTIKGK
ncbi:MAG: hypothetical protein IT258_04540 [Saprospiraceae bacterium]|nr:hypothetical protein [Saprospiraceae bacterium]